MENAKLFVGGFSLAAVYVCFRHFLKNQALKRACLTKESGNVEMEAEEAQKLLFKHRPDLSRLVNKYEHLEVEEDPFSRVSFLISPPTYEYLMRKNIIRPKIMRMYPDLGVIFKREPNASGYHEIHLFGKRELVVPAGKEIQILLEGMRNYVAENIWIPVDCIGRLVGRRGDNISSLRSFYNVEIDIHDETTQAAEENLNDTNGSDVGETKLVSVSGKSTQVTSAICAIYDIVLKAKGWDRIKATKLDNFNFKTD